jgi:hypothetical protein
MAECNVSAVISENPPGMDYTDVMDTSWIVQSSSRRRGPKAALRNDNKFKKSTDSLVDVTNRFDASPMRRKERACSVQQGAPITATEASKAPVTNIGAKSGCC